MTKTKRARGRVRVLIVDDDGPTRELVRALLEDEEMDLFEAGTGEDALELASRHRPHVVLLDIMMPGMDGYEVCRRMRSTPALSSSSIFMLTAKRLPDDRRLGLEAGADDYLTKPFSPLQLMDTIRSAASNGRH